MNIYEFHEFLHNSHIHLDGLDGFPNSTGPIFSSKSLPLSTEISFTMTSNVLPEVACSPVENRGKLFPSGDILRQEVSPFFFQAWPAIFSRKGSPEPPRVMEVLLLTLSFLFIWRFFSDSCHAFSYEWWSLDLQHFQNQKEKHLCRTFADHNYKSSNYQGHHLKPKVESLSLVRKKKTSSQIQPCSTNGSRHEPKALVTLVYMTRVNPPTTHHPTRWSMFFLDTSTRRKQTNTMFVKKSAYRF